MVWNVLWIGAMGASLAFVLGAFSSDPLLVDVVSGGLGVELRGADGGAGGSVVMMEGAVIFEVMAVAAFLAAIVYMLANSMTQQIDLFPGDTLNYSHDTLNLHALQALHGAAAIRANIAGETDPVSLNLKMRAVEQLLADYQTQSMGFAAQDGARQPKGKQQPSASMGNTYLQNPANATAPPNGKALRAADPAALPSSSRAMAGAVLPAGAAGAAGGVPSAGRPPNPVAAAAAAPAVAGAAGVGAGAADALLAGGVPASIRAEAKALVERELKEKDLKDLKEAERSAPSLAPISLSLSSSCSRRSLGARH